MSIQFEFVPTGDSGKPTAAHRGLIRSRCMQGKNKREGSRRSKRQEKRAARNTSQTLQTLQNSQPLRPLPSSLALVQLPGELGLHSEEILFKYLTYGAIRNLVAPIEVCVNVDTLKPNYFVWPFYDLAFFHAAMLVTSATNDYLLKQSPSKTTHFHLRRTLYLLNENLSKPDAYLVDSNVYIIVMLTLMAATFGDYAAAGVHMDGLQRIVNLRGGIKYLRCHPNIHYKLDRLDLSWCLGFGGKPRFVDNNISWSPTFTPSTLSIDNDAGFRVVECNFVDSRLSVVFHDVRHLVCIINQHFSKDTKFHGHIFQQSINSVQSRLLLLKDTLSNAIDECVCLALLAFMTTTFYIPGRKVPYMALRKRLLKSYQVVEGGHPGLRDMKLWMLIICSISVLQDDEVWLSTRWRAMGGRDMTWEQTRRRLKNFIWIDFIHDNLGREMFAKLTGSAQETGAVPK